MTLTEFKREFNKAYPSVFAKLGFNRVKERRQEGGKYHTYYYFEKEIFPEIRVVFRFHLVGHWRPKSTIPILTCFVYNKPQVRLTKELFAKSHPTIEEHYGTFVFTTHDIIGRNAINTEHYLSGEKSMEENLEKFEKFLTGIMLSICEKYCDLKVLCRDLKNKQTIVRTNEQATLPVLHYMVGEYAEAKKCLDTGLQECKDNVREAEKAMKVIQENPYIQMANEQRYNDDVEWLNAYTIFRSNLCKLIDEKMGEMTFMEKVRYKMTDMWLAMWLKMREMWRNVR